MREKRIVRKKKIDNCEEEQKIMGEKRALWEKKELYTREL